MRSLEIQASCGCSMGTGVGAGVRAVAREVVWARLGTVLYELDPINSTDVLKQRNDCMTDEDSLRFCVRCLRRVTRERSFSTLALDIWDWTVFWCGELSCAL